MSDAHQTDRARFRTAWIVAGLLLLAVATAVWWWRPKTVTAPPPSPPAAEVRLPVEDRPVLDYDALGQDAALKETMDRRKARFGIDRELDMIVTADETLRIGDRSVSMAEIQRQIALKEGRILESEAGTSGASAPDEVYGIHLVKPGDNLWNIHFALLKAYFDRKGIELASQADEPHPNGSSSGVGRLLKFSEGIVYIYNLHERRLELNIDAIYPRSKIVVYKMKPVFDLLDRIDATALDLIRFDGDTLWLPARQ